jgi:NAD(P)-dependent dehydrogenase (short-subunit alcohol dehydrogenase family)
MSDPGHSDRAWQREADAVGGLLPEEDLADDPLGTPASPLPLAGKVVVVTVGGSDLGTDLAASIEAAGATVRRVGDSRFGADVAVDLADPAYAREAFQRAIEPHGRLDALVHASFEAEGLHPKPFVEQDPTQVAQVWERSVWSTIASLQFAHSELAGRGGAVVVVTSTIGDVGGEGFGPWSAAIGAQRALVRSAARQWGEDAISVTAVAPDVTLVAGAEHERPSSLAGPAFGIHTGPDDLGGVIVLLLTDAARSLTGQTVTVDGGSWMAP